MVALWQQFLSSWNGRFIFLESGCTEADDLQLFINASGTKGFGAYFAGERLRGDWLPSQRLSQRSIQWQELFAIVAATMTWSSKLRGRRVRFHCDNEAIVLSWQRKSAKQPQLVALLCHLFLIAAISNFTSPCSGEKECYRRCMHCQGIRLTASFLLFHRLTQPPTPTPLSDELAQL